MKPTLLLLPFVITAHASWFSSDTPSYNSWDSTQLKTWLIENNLWSPSLDKADQSTLQGLVQANWNSASAWTQDQYNSAQKSFQGVKHDAFESCKLRSWLLEQGIVAPAGPREQLLLMAKNRYNGYASAAQSLGSQATAAASTAVFGDSAHQASKSVESVAAQATHQVSKALDDSKDYIYSTWSDSDLKSYLVKNGVVKSDAEKTRDQMLQMMRTSYASVADPVWEAWSDTYTRQWLLDQNLISPSSPFTTRSDLTAYMRKYYYNTNDYVWNAWSDSELHKWLVTNGYIKSDAQVTRDKMQKMVADTYNSATSTIVNAFSDSELRAWAIKHNLLRSDAQIKRDELVDLVSTKYAEVKAKGSKYADKATDKAGRQYNDVASEAQKKQAEASKAAGKAYDQASAYGNEKYNDGAAKLEQLFLDAKSATKAGYLTWPDARLRAYLRQHGVSEDKLPTERPGLVQEARIRWVQSTTRAEQIYNKITELLNSGVEAAEDQVNHIWEILTGKYEEGKHAAGEKYEEGKRAADEKVYEGRQEAGEQMKKAGSKVQGEL